jgi:hypothetical protein
MLPHSTAVRPHISIFAQNKPAQLHHVLYVLCPDLTCMHKIDFPSPLRLDVPQLQASQASYLSKLMSPFGDPSKTSSLHALLAPLWNVS